MSREERDPDAVLYANLMATYWGASYTRDEEENGLSDGMKQSLIVGFLIFLFYLAFFMIL